MIVGEGGGGEKGKRSLLPSCASVRKMRRNTHGIFIYHTHDHSDFELAWSKSTSSVCKVTPGYAQIDCKRSLSESCASRSLCRRFHVYGWWMLLRHLRYLTASLSIISAKGDNTRYPIKKFAPLLNITWKTRQKRLLFCLDLVFQCLLAFLFAVNVD